MIHTTDAFFTFAKTALRVSRDGGVPMVNSIHTDTPVYAGLFTEGLIERLLGTGPRARWLRRQARVGARVERQFTRTLRDYLADCDRVLVSRPEDHDIAAAALSPERVGWLRRGIDRVLFHPDKRDRGWLDRTFDVPAGAAVVLFVGRVDRGKNALPLAQAVRALTEQGRALHLICAGDGEDRAAVRDLLGRRASCPGNLPQDQLARVYASSDLLAAPSAVETVGNVVMEAAAAGLPAIVNGRSVMARLIEAGVTGLTVDGADAGAWSRALATVLADRDRLAAMGRAPRRHAETAFPDWREVLEQDVLPVWRQAAGSPMRRGPGTPRWAAA